MYIWVDNGTLSQYNDHSINWYCNYWDFVLLLALMRSGRRNNAGIGIYIVIGIVSDVRTKKMLLIGEREEMAKNAGIGIEFRAKTNFCRLVTNNIFVLLFMIIEVFWVVLVCKKQVICLWTSTVLQNWSNNDDKYSHKFYHFCWTFLCDEWVKDAKKRWHCDYKSDKMDIRRPKQMSCQIWAPDRGMHHRDRDRSKTLF